MNAPILNQNNPVVNRVVTFFKKSKEKSKKTISKYKWIFFVVFCFFCTLFFGLIKTPSVSVIMSTYNRDSFLIKSINSILNQSYTDFEFIIIDDGSTDHTKLILKKYTELDKRIKIISHEKNKGLITSLNEGINSAKGKYIIRMDDDDVSYLWRFQKQVDFMERNKNIVLAGTWVSPLNDVIPYPFQNEIDPEKVKILVVSGQCPISHPSLIVRRSFLNKNNIRYRLEAPAAEDRYFYADVIAAGGEIVNIPETLLHYRLHSSNSMDYYITQRNSVQKLQGYLFKKFLPNMDRKDLKMCDFFKLLLFQNKSSKIFNQKKLKNYYMDTCLKNKKG